MTAAKRLDPGDLQLFHELIHERSGLDFPPSRLADLEQVILETVDKTALPGPADLLALLRSGGRGEALLSRSSAYAGYRRLFGPREASA